MQVTAAILAIAIGLALLSNVSMAREFKYLGSRLGFGPPHSAGEIYIVLDLREFFKQQKMKHLFLMCSLFDIIMMKDGLHFVY